MTVHFVTHFDSRFAARGIVMLESLRRAHPDARITVQCLDAALEPMLRSWFGDAVRLLPHDHFLQGSLRMRWLAWRRNDWEYYATQKPALTQHVLERGVADGDWLAWIDADTWWRAPLGAALEEIEGASVGLSPHRFDEASAEGIRYGRFNAGFVLFRADDVGRACAADWAADCRRWCRAKVRGDRFMNQGYLTAWPDRYARVRMLEHPGVNLAPWNLGRHTLAQAEGQVTVDGAPLVFFHASGLQRGPDGAWRTLYALPAAGAAVAQQQIYVPYLEAVERVAERLAEAHGVDGLQSAHRVRADAIELVGP